MNKKKSKDNKQKEESRKSFTKPKPNISREDTKPPPRPSIQQEK